MSFRTDLIAEWEDVAGLLGALVFGHNNREGWDVNPIQGGNELPPPRRIRIVE